MKKVLSILSVGILCCELLAGCGSGESDITKLPHNKKISIGDLKEEVIKKDNLTTEDEITYKTDAELNDHTCNINFVFNNAGEIAIVIYDLVDAPLEEMQEYIDKLYGELEKDTEGKYGPGRDTNYIIKYNDKTWLIGCFVADNGNTRIVISRDATLD